MSRPVLSGIIVMLFGTAVLSLNSCRNLSDELECIGESALFDIGHTVDTSNSLMVDLEMFYYGDFMMAGTIDWDFGDGQVQTLSGTTAQHTYSAPGTYTVSAVPTVNEGNEFCSPMITESVTVN